MFEVHDALATWSVELLPGTDSVAATRLTDHRLDYLDYEGPISRGRGVVSQEDSGPFQLISLTAERALFHLEGNRWSGIADFILESELRWRLSFSQSIKESARRVLP